MQIPPDVLRQCWFLAGPTACGKSRVAVDLAAGLRAEIVSLDSMSLYREMVIGTAKPSPEIRRAVPHHLIDVLKPHETCSLAEYLERAERVCRDILSRGRLPLFVGGTGLYLRGVLRGVFDAPSADWEFRRRLEDEARGEDAEFLHRRLQAVDAPAAAVLHPHDTRRLIRALEVHHLTGRAISDQQRQEPLPPGQRPRHVYWLSPPRQWLYERIDRRVEMMFDDGLVDEVARLLSAPKPLSRTARQALGYKEVIDFLQGRGTLAETIERVKTRTRQFAKRQHTWYRHLEECVAVTMTGDETPEELSARIVAQSAVDSCS